MHSPASPPPSSFGGEHSRSRASRAGAKCERQSAGAFSLRRTRSFHHRQIQAETGNGRNLRRGLAAAPCSTRLSYRPPLLDLTGFEPATTRPERSNRSLHHRFGSCFVGERARRLSALPIAKPCGPNPRHDAPREGASTARCITGGIRTRFSGSEVIRLFTTDKLCAGITRQNSPSRPWQRLRRGGQIKTPPEPSSGGVRKIEHSKWDQPIPPPRESMRSPHASGAVTFDRMNAHPLFIFACLLPQIARANRVRRARCMIAMRHFVKRKNAHLSRFS
jgi:hypothetical protein